jgi:hypothetical protein
MERFGRASSVHERDDAMDEAFGRREYGEISKVFRIEVHEIGFICS